MGFFWGVDQDSIVDLFFDKVRTQKPGKSSLSVLVHDRNRSGVVELVGREPLIIARVENGVTKFSIPVSRLDFYLEVLRARAE